MNADTHSNISPAAQTFLDGTSMKSILGISDQALNGVMAFAYQLYNLGRYHETEILCGGLVAANHKHWWSYSLHAAALRRLGRLREAIDVLDTGLKYEQAQPKLLCMRAEIHEALAQNTSKSVAASAPPTNLNSLAAA
jgi:tetratricopeptide (TPR) repeat protein